MRRPHRYILRGHEPVPCEDLLEWAQWLDTSDDLRLVRRDQVRGVRVQTDFLGIDPHYSGEPRLFETMVFGGALDGVCVRCATWLEAERQHDEVLARALAADGLPAAAEGA